MKERGARLEVRRGELCPERSAFQHKCTSSTGYRRETRAWEKKKNPFQIQVLLKGKTGKPSGQVFFFCFLNPESTLPSKKHTSWLLVVWANSLYNISYVGKHTHDVAGVRSRHSLNCDLLKNLTCRACSPVVAFIVTKLWNIHGTSQFLLWVHL